MILQGVRECECVEVRIIEEASILQTDDKEMRREQQEEDMDASGSDLDPRIQVSCCCCLFFVVALRLLTQECASPSAAHPICILTVEV